MIRLSVRCTGVLLLAFAAAASPAGAQVTSTQTRVGALLELGGVHFQQQRYAAAAELAEAALTLRPDDAYAAELLASSRFLLGDMNGALRAWNRAGAPRNEQTRIESQGRTPVGHIAAALRMQTGDLVTSAALAQARRRVAALPAVWRSRVDYRPVRPGAVDVDAAVAERPIFPLSPTDLAAHGLRGVIDQRMRLELTSPRGGGELWLFEWHWQRNRRRLEAGIAVPHAFGLPGVGQLRVHERAFTHEVTSADPQSENTLRRELHRTVAASVSDWISGLVRWQLSTSTAWTDRGPFAGVGAELELRDPGDRATVRAAAERAWSRTHEPFHILEIEAAARAGGALASTEWLMSAGAALAAPGAPRALWPAAGVHDGADALLRAHPLFDDAGVAVSEFFGPRLLHASIEMRRWVQLPAAFRLAGAAFVDAASVRRWPDDNTADAAVDVGAGVRLRLPAVPGVIRADAAVGVLDGAAAISLGWWTTRPAW